MLLFYNRESNQTDNFTHTTVRSAFKVERFSNSHFEENLSKLKYLVFTKRFLFEFSYNYERFDDCLLSMYDVQVR